MESLLSERPGGPADFCSADFDYTPDGAITREGDYSELGDDYAHTLGMLTYTENLAQVLTQGALRTHSVLRFIYFRRDARGYDVGMRYMSAPGVPAPDRHGNFGYALQYDNAGHVAGRTVLDADGKPAPEKR